MIPRKGDPCTEEPRSGPKTLDSVINATSIFQRPLMVLLFRALPSSGSILGMTFLAPKIQNFTCVSSSYDTNAYWQDEIGNVHDPRCFSSGREPCSEWSFDRTIFDNTFRSEFSAVCQWGWIINFSDSLVMVGMMLGNFAFSHVSDWYGRRIANIGSVLFSFLGAIAMAASPNVLIFVALRTIMAMGLGGGQIGTFTLAMESVNPTKRFAVPFCDSFGWILGILLLPIPPWFYRGNWRYLQLIFSLANIPLLVMSIITDESPRWLLATGRTDRARPVIKRLLRKNGMPDSDEDVEEVINSTDIQVKTSKANIGDLLENRTLALTTLSFLIQYAISIFVYYDMMFFVVNDGDNIWLNVLFTGIFEIPCLLIVALLVEYGPRKVLYWIIYLTSGVTAGALLFTREDQKSVRGVLATISKTGVQLLFPILGVHVNESFITRKRGIAMGLGTTFSRVGGIIAPSLKPLSSEIHAIMNAGVCLFGLATAIPLKETFKKPLPETEGEDSSAISEVSCIKRDDPITANAVVESIDSERDKTSV